MSVVVNTTAEWLDAGFSPFDGVELAHPVSFGPVHDYGRVVTDHAVQWVMTGTVDNDTNRQVNGGCSLQGSLDGTHWYDVGTDANSQWTANETGVSKTVLNIATDKPARYVRAVGSASDNSQGAFGDLTAPDKVVANSTLIYRV